MKFYKILNIYGGLALKYNSKLFLVYMKNYRSYSVFTHERFFLVEGIYKKYNKIYQREAPRNAVHSAVSRPTKWGANALRA